jgi:nucleotide-binding universal stress UspA family protein
MFKHFLIPTDGSPAAQACLQSAMTLAQACQARVTGLHVIQPFHFFTYDIAMIEDTRAMYEKHSAEHARAYLATIERAAKDKGVLCETKTLKADEPYEAIIKAAKGSGCDLIVMASHGRRGVQALLLGSQTQKLLTHCDIPVLVVPAPGKQAA